MAIRGSIAVACCVALIAAADATAQAPIGGPPSNDFPRCNRFTRPCGDPIVVGAGTTRFGVVEIVAYTSALGLCVDVDVVDQGGAGSCPEEPPTHTIEAFGVSGSFGGRSGSYTQIDGTVTSEVTSVRARYRRNGKRHQASAIVGRIEGELQTRLEQPRPYGLFVATVPGCVSAHRFRLAAMAADGTVLARVRGPVFEGLPDICEARHTGGQWTTFKRVPGRLR